MVAPGTTLHGFNLRVIAAQIQPPTNSQIERALWSSSITFSTSTVRNRIWRRSMEANRGEGGVASFVTSAVYELAKIPQ